MCFPMFFPVRRLGVRIRPTLHFPTGSAGRVRSLALAGVGSSPRSSRPARRARVSQRRGERGDVHDVPVLPAGVPAAVRGARRAARDVDVPSARGARRLWGTAMAFARRRREPARRRRGCGRGRGGGRRGRPGGRGRSSHPRRRTLAGANDECGPDMDGARAGRLAVLVPRLAVALCARAGPRGLRPTRRLGRRACGRRFVGAHRSAGGDGQSVDRRRRASSA